MTGTMTEEQKLQWHNEVLTLTDNQQKMEELTSAAQEAIAGAHPIWTLRDQFRLMAYNDQITGAEYQALRRFHNLPGRLF